MATRINSKLLAYAAAPILLAACSAAGPIDLGTLADELGDRDTLAVHPDGAYTMHQASSHDPRNAEGYSSLGAPWGFANVDFGNYLGQVTIDGRKEWVVLEDSGPGVITRWWTTAIDGKTLDHRFRIYLNGSDTPAITATGTDLLGGNTLGFGEALDYTTPERGGNTYAPIAYQDGVRITWDGPATHQGASSTATVPDPNANHQVANAVWYNINYRKLPKGAKVDSYSADDTTTFQANLQQANDRLLNLAVTGDVSQRHKDRQSVVDGGAVTHRLSGTGAIRRVQVKVTGADQVAALADAMIVLTFDNQQTARIPVGEFFGNGESDSKEKPYNVGSDYMRSVAADGVMTSYWVMPYRHNAEVKIENGSGQSIDVELEIDSGSWRWDENSMHFHADYRREDNILTRQAPGGPWPGNAGKQELYSAEGDADFRFIDIRGRGVFVGDTMSIRNLSTGAGLNTWWGEGDEKIYIDYLDADGNGSAAKPDHLGTGTEDYYGYSFGSGREFLSPFVTQPNAAGNRSDRGALTIQGRVRGLDAIPFDESFKFDMEVWKWREGKLDLSAATFWYGTPGSASMHVVADLAMDFKAAADGTRSGKAGIADTAGDGQWVYLASDKANPKGAKTQELAWGKVGNAGNAGYGGGENGPNNLAAISNKYIFDTGPKNIGIQDEPGYREVQVHPGGGFEFGGGNSERQYVVSRWIAGEPSAGLININGSIRNLADGGDSVDFYIYVDGVPVFEAKGNDDGDGMLPETYFDLDTTVGAGSTVDFVVGNNSASGNPYHDESALRATILGIGDTTTMTN